MYTGWAKKWVSHDSTVPPASVQLADRRRPGAVLWRCRHRAAERPSTAAAEVATICWGRRRVAVAAGPYPAVHRRYRACNHIRSRAIVVWPTMSCFADWSKRRHVTLSIITCSPLHSHPGWHYNVTPGDVTWRSLNANVRYILRCFCLRFVCFVCFFGVLL